MVYPEVKPVPFGHDPTSDTLPGLEDAHAVGSDDEAGVEDAVVEAVMGEWWPCDDVVAGFGEAEEVGVEEEVVAEGEGQGA